MIKQSETKLTVAAITPVRSITAVVKATVAAHIFLIICFALLALVYTYSGMPNAYLTPCVHAISVISLLLAGFIAAKKVKFMGYIHGGAAGLVCAVVRILAGYIVFKSYVPSDSIAKTVITAIVISAVGGVAGVNFAKNKKRKK